MKFKIQAGGEIDLITKDEMSDLLDQHTLDFDRMLSEGLKYGKLSSGLFSAINSESTPLYTGGVYQLGGPEPGYIWSIKNISYSNLGATGCDLLLNGNNPSDLVVQGLVNSGTQYPGSNGVMVHGGQNLMVGAKNALVGAAIVLYYLEVPMRDIGKL